MPASERKAKLPPDLAPAAASADGLASHQRVLGAVAWPGERAPMEPLGSDGAEQELIARKEALAADLEDMIGGMLRTTQFASAATAKARNSSRQTAEVVALDAATGANAFTPNSLVADLARSRPVPAGAAAQPAPRRRWWIDAILVLACVLSVLSAGYFTFAP